MTQPSKKFISLYDGAALGVGEVTQHVSLGSFVAGYMSISGSPDLMVVVEGAMGESSGHYTPKENEWTVIQQMTSQSFFTLRMVPTLARVRVTNGTMTRAVGHFFYDSNILPTPLEGLSASEAGGLIDAAIQGMQEQVNTAQTAATGAKASLTTVSTAALATKKATDIPPILDGHRWLPRANGTLTVNGGTVVQGDGTLWQREFWGDVHADWFPGTDREKIVAALSAATRSKTVQLAARIYNIDAEFDMPNGLTLRGVDPGLIGDTRLLATTDGMRSVVRAKGQFSKLEDLKIDGNRLAKYGIYEMGAAYSVYRRIAVTRCTRDGIRAPAPLNGAPYHNNDGMLYEHVVLEYNGTLYASANALLWPSLTANIPAEMKGPTQPGGVTLTENSRTVTGTGTTFLAAGVGKGDRIRVGSFLGEIETVDSNTKITLTVTNLPAPADAGGDQAYLLAAGSGRHEEFFGDNNITQWNGGLIRANAASGLVFNGYYGPTISQTQFDYNVISGIRVGSASSDIPCYAVTMNSPYLESNGGKQIEFMFAFGFVVNAPLLGPEPGEAYFFNAGRAWGQIVADAMSDLPAFRASSGGQHVRSIGAPRGPQAGRMAPITLTPGQAGTREAYFAEYPEAPVAVVASDTLGVVATVHEIYANRIIVALTNTGGGTVTANATWQVSLPHIAN